MALHSVRKSSRTKKEPSRFKDYDVVEKKQRGSQGGAVRGGNNRRARGKK